jgi:phosphoribosylformimino-5-aminoimidazole carboxamide ribotide isomerase
MQIYPAIDLMGGNVVRLRQGRKEDTISYATMGSALELARRWEEEGAEMIHVVDLDAVLALGDNESVLRSLLTGVSVPIQFGGGVRSLGVERVILGTLAVRIPGDVLTLCSEFGPARVMVAIDIRQDQLLVDGWRSQGSKTPSQLLTHFRKQGVHHFLMTSVDADGGLGGPDLCLSAVCGPVRSDIILAGGVTSVTDIRALACRGFAGAVVGRALYEGLLTLPDAIAAGRGFLR